MDGPCTAKQTEGHENRRDRLPPKFQKGQPQLDVKQINSTGKALKSECKAG
jgi:hypothetical protein